MRTGHILVAVLMLAGFLVWRLFAGDLAPNGPAQTAIPPRSADPAPAPAMVGAARESGREVVDPGSGSSSHSHAGVADRLFDLTLPKSKRQLCADCDPVRSALAARFSDEDERLLGRIAQFGDYTEGEVWRLASSADVLDSMKAALGPLVASWEAKALSYLDHRSRLSEKMLAEGSYVEYRDPPDAFGDESSVVTMVSTSSGAVYRVVTLRSGLDKAYDTALSDRQEALLVLQANINSLLRRSVHDTRRR